ncbi:MAG: PBP1A family penicillin-binding protein [Myxococcota bacterium]|nr:PBP1A family penicillin-binding protein [Myxococcota bacterium]
MAFIRPGGSRIVPLSVALLGLALAAGGLWFYLTFLRDLPNLNSVADFRPPLASRVLDRNGTTVGEFYNQRRTVAPLLTIPEYTRLAFVAAEDQNFFEHAGIDYRAILRAALVDLRAGEIKEGASTITMQLVKQLLLSPEKRFRRKIREMILARQIEARFSKDEILYLYLNQIYFGHGAWGIGEAARSYFGKSVSELTVSESALLAGLPQRPSEYSPYRDPVAAEKRRKSVVRRMQSMRVIDRAGAEQAFADVPVLMPAGPNEDYVAARHFTEEIRRYLYDRLGGDAVLEGGLVIETTLDLELQRVAMRAIESGLTAHDRRYGYRGHVRHVELEELEAEIATLAETNGLLPQAGEEEEIDPGFDSTNEQGLPAEAVAGPILPVGEPLLGVVTAVDEETEVARVSFAPGLEAEVHLADVAWAREPDPKKVRPQPVARIGRIFAAGDVGSFTLLAEGSSKAPYPEEAEQATDEGEEEAVPPLPRGTLDQTPKVEGALLSIETATGDVLAMVGGRDYRGSEFNRATQALRQPGSAFKPFIYGAALSRDYTPVSIIHDRPVVIEDRDSGFVWRPRNYSRHFYGPLPIRKALAKSVNNATVHLFRDVGVDYVIDYARRLGITSPLSRDLTLALGSSDVTLLELTTAYAIFPNGGRRVVPRFITKVTGRDGQVLLEDIALGNPPPPVLKPLEDPNQPQEQETAVYPDGEILPTDRIISEAEAFLMCDLLKAVVQHGTGRGVRRLAGYLGGKTGTTNDQADAWFMGFSPDVTTGVWVGYDSVKLLGWGETGAKAALPIWRDYMRAALKGKQVRDFEAPDEIVYERVDPETGLLADAGTAGAYFQPFLESTAPTESSSKRSRVTDTRRSLREDAFQ